MLLLASWNVYANSERPGQFVTLNHVLPSASFDIRYATQNNFVGERVDGYIQPLCIISKIAAEALVAVNQDLAAKNMRLKIFDCYRPAKAVDHFMRWVKNKDDQKTKTDYYPNLNKESLLGGYIAERSGHSRGYTVDLSIEYKNEQGSYSELDMGSAYDLFDSISNTASPLITQTQMENRLLLKNLMSEHGFADYSMEWWHFTHRSDPRDSYWNFDVK
nr:M15 family metallopeptidase [Paraglaciecola sp. G1-23]